MGVRKAWRIYSVALAASVAFGQWADAHSRGASTPFGLPHSTIGKASTTMAGNKLFVGNLSFGTDDGVAIQLGHVRGWSMDFDPEPAAGDYPIDVIAVKAVRIGLALRGSGVGSSQQLTLTRNALGKMEVSTTLENVSITSIHVALLLNGTVVDTASFPPGTSGPLIVGDIGLSPFHLSARNFATPFENGRFIMRSGVPVRAKVELGVEHDVDEYRITYKTSDKNGNNKNWSFGSATVTGWPAQGIPGATASFGITSESLVQMGCVHTALNFATMTGLASAGDPDGDLHVAGIGSNGSDGVAIDLSNHPNSGLGTPNFRMTFAQPLALTTGGIAITGRGTVATGIAGPVGTMRWDALTGGSMLLTGDAGNTGATEVLIEAFDDGNLVVSAVRSFSAPLGQMNSTAAGLPRKLEVEVERRAGGFLRGAPGTAGAGLAISVKFDRDGLFAPYLDPFVTADEVRMTPLDPTETVDALNYVDITGRGFGAMTIGDEVVEAKYDFPTIWGGVAHSPIGSNVFFSSGPAGELVVESGAAGEFGASLDLGCAQGGAVRYLSGPPTPGRVEEPRTILKTYFETGKIPTEEQFSTVIDSAADGTGNENLVLFAFGFNPQKMQAEARIGGVTVDQVTHPVLPATIAEGNLLDGAAPVLVNTFAQDTDGNGGLDRMVFIFSEPVATLITLTGSAIGPVDADQIVVTMTLPPDFLGTCIDRMDVTAENMLSFSLTDPSIIQFGNTHSAPTGVPIEGLIDDGGTGHLDMFFLVGSPTHVMNGDGVVIQLFADGPAGAMPTGPNGGIVFDMHSGFNVLFNPREYTITKRCSPSLGLPFDETSSVSLDLSPDGTSRTVDVGPIRWMAPEAIRSRIYAADGSVMADSGETGIGAVAVIMSPDLPTKQSSKIVLDASRGTPAGVEFEFTWDADVVILLPGQKLQEGRTLRIIATPAAGAQVLPVDVVTAELTATTDEPAEYVLAEEATLALAAPCVADIAAPFGKVDVFDLFVLLSNWNSNGPGADLADDVLIADVFDLFKLLSSWGDCP